MLTVNNVSKSFGDEYILEDISFVVNDSDKIGIVGKNGAGKSTLLKCMINDDYQTSGSVDIKGNIGYVEQDSSFVDDKSLYEQLLMLFPELYEMYKYLKTDDVIDAETYIKKEELFRNKGGYEFRVKVDKLLTGFGFVKDDINRQYASFSGGEKTKLALIKLLVLEPDYLFLDEPTNHLDINAIVWLEKYLAGLKKSIILVSHDEVFLENVCNKIILVENKSIRQYKMKYTNYLKQRKLDYINEMQAYEKQIAQISKYEDFIEKNRQKPSKIGQVNDRKAKLEQIKMLKKPQDFDVKVNFEFEGYHLKKSTYIDFFNTTIGYDNTILIENINFKVYGGEKIAIIGKNGVGKSTLFKAILEGKGISGKIRIPANIKIGYYDQEHKNINGSKTLYDLIDEFSLFESQSAIRKFLGSFLFTKDDVFKKFEMLSGGQKVRFSLAYMSLKKYDILLLDEPTNHLDMEMKSLFIDALKKFPGTLIFISHDRRLINEMATRILYFNEKHVEEFSGNWDDYLENIKFKKNKKLENDSKNNTKEKSKKINVQKLEKIEKEIEENEKNQQDLLQKLSDPNVAREYEKVKHINEELDEITSKLEILYEKYEEIFS